MKVVQQELEPAALLGLERLLDRLGDGELVDFSHLSLPA
jgi:hypothetical protein